MTDNTNIHQRIGEAITSGGKFNIIRADNPREEQILTDAGFVKVGSIKEGNNIVSLFKIELKQKEVVKIVEVPTNKNNYPWNQIKDPAYPYTNPGIWYTNNHWLFNDPNKIMYTNLSTGTGNADWVQKGLNKTISTAISGNLSTRLDAAYDPLSVLQDYTFNQVLDKNQ